MLLVAAASVLAGCGSQDPDASAPATPTPSLVAASDETAWASGSWLLGFTTAGGSEGEDIGTVYVRFTPSTGATAARTLPAADQRDTSSGSRALLVSADQKYLLLDSSVTRANQNAGRLTLYPVAGTGSVKVDLRSWSKNAALQPIGAAFDPAVGDLLRVVDSRRGVWKVDLAARTAVRDGSLPSRAGWIFANGFDKNTGLPYIEDIDSSATLPAGNGDDDVRPVQRRGGVISSADGETPDGVPAPPCGFSGGFVAEGGDSWLFCADTPRITAYRLTPGGKAWVQVGTASKPVVPETAEGVPVVLPPVSSPGD